MLKKGLLGLGMVLMLAFSFAIPAFASTISEGELVKAEGTIQSVDTLSGSFTVLAEDGTVVTVYAPAGFDLTLLVVGDQVEAKGSIGTDGLFAASEVELQDGTDFDVEDADETEIEGDTETEIEDDTETEIEDADQNEVEDQDENEIEDSEESGDSEHDEGSSQTQSDSGSESGGESGED